jgi:hypothetical protein
MKKADWVYSSEVELSSWIQSPVKEIERGEGKAKRKKEVGGERRGRREGGKEGRKNDMES